MYDSQRNRRRNVQRLDGILHDMIDVLGIHKHASEGSLTILEPLDDPNLGKVQSVCHEEYLGTLEGYPLYETGFETVNCSYAPDLGKVVTLLFNVVGYKREEAEELVMGAINTFPGVDVIAGSYR